MTRTSLALALATALLVAGCPGEPDSPPPPPPKDTPKAGRPETRDLRNLDTIGVNGSNVADKVDEAIRVSEDRQKQLDAEAAKSE